MHSERDKDGLGTEFFTGRDILYREGAIGPLDVQRAADALLRQGKKPSVAAIREQLGGGSPNTITPLLAKYWEKLGSRLGDGPESLERVPEALARVTELLWRRAIEEARERLKLLQSPDRVVSGAEALQEQVMKLSVGLAEARAREGEQLTHLGTLSKERERLRAERGSLLALLKGAQTLLEQQNARVISLESGGRVALPRATKRPTNKVKPRPKPKSKRATKRVPRTRRRSGANLSKRR